MEAHGSDSWLFKLPCGRHQRAGSRRGEGPGDGGGGGQADEEDPRPPLRRGHQLHGEGQLLQVERGFSNLREKTCVLKSVIISCMYFNNGRFLPSNFYKALPPPWQLRVTGAPQLPLLQVRAREHPLPSRCLTLFLFPICGLYIPYNLTFFS